MSESLRILCVDDEPLVLQGLALHLRRDYEVVSAVSGEEGLAALDAEGPFAVVLSDMRMPGMDGATFLARVRERAPDTTRMLLTGFAEMQAAIAAVNEGQIFRFLTKPCPPPQLRQAFVAAVEQHRLVTAERVLLEQTLLGSIRALTDVLSMTSPLVFGRATRVQALVRELATAVGAKVSWALEVAAIFSQLGFIVVPDDVVKRQQIGALLGNDEQAMVARVPAVTESLLAHIPRLEVVRQILGCCAGQEPARCEQADRADVTQAAGILRLALDYDELESRGLDVPTVLDTLRGRDGYDAVLLAGLVSLNDPFRGRDVHEVALGGLLEGMIVAEDVRLASGALLVARGFRITAHFLERTRNFGKGHVREPLRVVHATREAR